MVDGKVLFDPYISDVLLCSSICRVFQKGHVRIRAIVRSSYWSMFMQYKKNKDLDTRKQVLLKSISIVLARPDDDKQCHERVSPDITTDAVEDHGLEGSGSSPPVVRYRRSKDGRAPYQETQAPRSRIFVTLAFVSSSPPVHSR